MRTIRGNPYLSRPIGTNKPYHLVRREPVAAKEVFIGQRDPQKWRCTQVSHEWVPIEQRRGSR